MADVPWGRLLAGALAVHLVWGLARMPTKVVARRAELIADHRRDGQTAALFDASGLDGADAVEWLRAHTPPDAAIAWAGSAKGAMEFAAALLWPRLLVADDDGAGGAGGAGPAGARALAHGTRDGRTGRLVLVGSRRAVRLEVR